MIKSTTSKAGGSSQKAGTFKKGDPRINRNGRMSKKRIGFTKALKDLLVDEGEKVVRHNVGTVEKPEYKRKKKVEWLVRSVWGNAIAGEAWAVNFIADHVEGKLTQPLEIEGLSMKRMKESLQDTDES